MVAVNKVINVERETLILIGVIISGIALWLTYVQYKEQKELNALQKQLHEHELKQIKEGV